MSAAAVLLRRMKKDEKERVVKEQCINQSKTKMRGAVQAETLQNPPGVCGQTETFNMTGQ